EGEWGIELPPEAGIYKDAKGFSPCALTVGPDGSIFVADGYGANYVLKFDKNRKFEKAFGGPGEEEGKFKTCHGIALDTRQGKPLLFVCNRNNNRVEYWDLDGNFVKVIQKDLRMPAAVHIRGDYAVIPELKGRVTVLDKDGAIVAQVGDNPDEKQRANFGLPKDQWKDGICNSPHGASIDKDGNLIVTEWRAFGHMQKFAPMKKAQTLTAARGDAEGMPPGGLRKVPNALPRSSRSITIRGAASLRQRTARQEELVFLLRRAPRARIRAVCGAVGLRSALARTRAGARRARGH